MLVQLDVMTRGNMIYISDIDWERLDDGRACALASKIQGLKGDEQAHKEDLSAQRGNPDLEEDDLIFSESAKIYALDEEFYRTYGYHADEFQLTDDEEDLAHDADLVTELIDQFT